MSTISGNSGLSVNTDTFLKLLVAQLQYQDPLNPQKDTEFVTQLAQMTSLEEMKGLNSSFSSVQAYNLVGKTAYAEVNDSETGKTTAYYGTVDSIVEENGTYYAMIGDEKTAISDIVQVFNTEAITGGFTIAEASNLIGRTITGTYTNDEAESAEVTGTVTSVAVKNGIVYAYVGETAVAAPNITSVEG